MPRCYDGLVRAFALTVLCGCRSILGIEDVDVIDLADPDANPIDSIHDATNDAPALDGANGCPASFMALPNSGPRGHRYRETPSPGGWLDMRDFCATVGGFLAFPDGSNTANAQQELTALITLSGNGLWIGVNDLGTEGTFRTSLNQTLSAVTSSFIQGGNSMQNDCAVAQTDKFNIEDCGNTHNAVCECVP